jgi:hypothetical protein
MALAAALLVTLVCGSVLAAATLVAGLERRAASAYATAAALRHAAAGGLVAAAGELEARDWGPVLAGGVSEYWQGSVAVSTDVAGLSAALERETMSGSAHGADTPSWQVFIRTPWAGVAGQGGRIDLVVWVADDWQERDANPAADSNGLILVRAAAVQGPALAWSEGLFGRDPEGRLRPVHTRVW